jgi:DNA polymerase elongation subunit (family B)
MYVDALFDRDKDRIHIVERDKNGQREFKDFAAKYIFYYDDPKGKQRSIHGTPVTRVQCRTMRDFRKELKLNGSKRLYESDINPVFRCLEENYLGQNAPELQVAFFDIEVDFDPNKGFSPPEDPFNPVTAVSVYLQWLEQMVTLCIKPKGLSKEEAQAICNKFDNCFLFDTEAELLDTFLNLIDDADILSGWNSEGYDIPYMVNRVKRVLSKDDTRRFCLWGQYPKQRTFERFGAENITFDTIGRVHMDYMQLYRKYTYHEMHSYSLDAIGEYELDERKVQYEGTLDQLYNNDFEKFLDYNIQDTALLNKLDRKLKFIELANELAHANTVLLATTMGAVAVTEQAIINEAHERGLVVPSRKSREELGNTQAAGAYVAYPKKGMHDWIGAIDINSLYPSAIRALNMGNETIVGQLRQDYTIAMLDKRQQQERKSFAEAWEGEFGSVEYELVMAQDKEHEIVVEWENGTEDILTGAEIYKMVFLTGNPWMLSANGTIFNGDVKGVVPGLLERWYAERKELQAKMRDAKDDKEKAFWDKRQLVKKINLNSLYGAILNPGCRFFDKRIGQSTTLCGRQIAKHMDAFVNEAITGEYNHVGEAIIYGDTDSCYFSAWPIVKEQVEAGNVEWTKDTVIELYDDLADKLNDSFPDFMKTAFNCPRENGKIIKGGREVVATKGLYITKKRYALLVYDIEGYRTDAGDSPGKIKAMGLDLKRSDTPKVVQDFLSDILTGVLTGDDRETVITKIKKFKEEFTLRPSWEKGSPKRANNMTKFTALEAKLGKANMPGHVRASMNWNNLCKMNSDRYSTQIKDGAKVIVCKLKPNPLGYTSVAYPTDELHLPQWFKELPFDDGAMEATVIDGKLENLLEVLNWDLTADTDTQSTFNDLFSFE